MVILPLQLPRIRCALFMRTKRAYLPQRDVSGESWLMLIGCKANQNACCNEKKKLHTTAWTSSTSIYLNPSAQGTGETLVELIGEPRTIFLFKYWLRYSHQDQKTSSTYDYIWRAIVLPSMLVIKKGTRRNVCCSLIY